MAYDSWVTQPTTTKKKTTARTSGLADATSASTPQQTGWNVPDYADLARNDPTYRSFLDQQSAAGIQDLAQLDGVSKRALIEAGLDNLDFGNSGLDQSYVKRIVSPDVLSQAKSNPFSASKRIDQALSENAIALRRYLRSRGAVRSGESGYGYQKIQNEADQSRFDLAQKLMDYLSNAQAGYAQSERIRQQQIQDELSKALERQMQISQPTPVYANSGVVNPPGTAVESGTLALSPADRQVLQQAATISAQTGIPDMSAQLMLPFANKQAMAAAVKSAPLPTAPKTTVTAPSSLDSLKYKLLAGRM